MSVLVFCEEIHAQTCCSCRPAFYGPSSGSKERDKHTAHFGGLILTVTAIDSVEERGGRPYVPAKPFDPRVPPPPPESPEGKGDHHYVAGFVNVKNDCKNPA